MELIDIEKLFDDFLLYNIEICHNDKILKSGKLKMVVSKNHNIKFFIETNASLKTIELFYPFSYKKTKNSIIFDYNIDTLVNDNIRLKLLIDNYLNEEASKFLNTKIYFNKKK